MLTAGKSRAVYDALVNLLDTINGEQDPLQRLLLHSYFLDLYRQRVIPARNATAYEARQKYAMIDILEGGGWSRQKVVYWIERHREATGAPALGRRERQDISAAIDLSTVVRPRRRAAAKAALPPIS